MTSEGLGEVFKGDSADTCCSPLHGSKIEYPLDTYIEILPIQVSIYYS
jgi:hypothetical protein